MRSRLPLLLLGALLTGALPPPQAEARDDSRRRSKADCPIVIAHRGASGYRPEHTLEAYELAIQQGADFIEPDLVITKDGELIARHDNVLNLTTDVATRPEFAHLRTSKMVDGVLVANSWFSEDFTLAEIKRLRAIERIPAVRPANAAYDGQFKIPTLREILELVSRLERRRCDRIGLYPETKHPTHFDGLGLSMEEPLVDILHQYGYRRPSDPVFLQSFEVANLKDLNRLTQLRLVQLLWLEGQPYDEVAVGGSLTYDTMATPAGLAAIARYADGVGPEKYYFIIPRDAFGNLDVAATTPFVQNAHAEGLLVHPYTFRAENAFLPTDYRGAPVADPLTLGDAYGEVLAFLATGIDGFFIDQPDIGVLARNAFCDDGRSCGRGCPDRKAPRRKNRR